MEVKGELASWPAATGWRGGFLSSGCRAGPGLSGFPCAKCKMEQGRWAGLAIPAAPLS